MSTTLNELAKTLGADLQARVRQLEERVTIMEEVMRVEAARSDFVWDRALQREAITEEEWALAREPDGLQHLQEARLVRNRTVDHQPG